MVEKADMADGLLLELEEERSRWLFVIIVNIIVGIVIIVIVAIVIMTARKEAILFIFVIILKTTLIFVLTRCDRLKECLEIERAEREQVEAGLGAEVRSSSSCGRRNSGGYSIAFPAS